MTGPSTMAHHHALHERVAQLLARLAEAEEMLPLRILSSVEQPDGMILAQVIYDSPPERESGDVDGNTTRESERSRDTVSHNPPASAAAKSGGETDPDECPNYWPGCGHHPHAGTCYEPPTGGVDPDDERECEG